MTECQHLLVNTHLWEKEERAQTSQENLEKPFYHLLCHKYVLPKLHVNQLLIKPYLSNARVTIILKSSEECTL